MENTKDRLDKLKLLLEQPKEEETIKPKRKGKSKREELAEALPLVPEIIHKGLQFDYEFSPKQLEFLELYIPRKYNITAICNEVGISRRTYYDWCKEKPGFEDTCNDLKEGMVDTAIETIMKAMEQMDSKAAIFVLKTLGKSRGFGETLDITSNGETIQIPSINILPPKDELED